MSVYLKHNFNCSTKDPQKFIIEDVADDNACCYRTLANELNYRIDTSKILDYEDFFKPLTTIKKKYEDVFEDESWGYDGIQQEELARMIQQKCLEWLISHKDMIYNEDLKMTYQDLVEDTHEMTFTEYQSLYGYFAGDLMYIEDKKNVGKKYIVDDRWGGIPEIEALSNICELPIVIYSPQKYNEKKEKIETGRIQREKAEKGVRFNLRHIAGRKYLETKQPILMLWRKTKHAAHYMCLYQASIDNLTKQDFV